MTINKNFLETVSKIGVALIGSSIFAKIIGSIFTGPYDEWGWNWKSGLVGGIIFLTFALFTKESAMCINQNWPALAKRISKILSYSCMGIMVLFFIYLIIGLLFIAVS